MVVSIRLVLFLASCQLASTRAETFQVSFDDEMKSCEHPDVVVGMTDSKSPVQRVKLPFTLLNEWQYRYFSAVKELQEIGNPICQKPNHSSSESQTDIFPINTPHVFDPFKPNELEMIANFVQHQLNLSLSEQDKNSSTSLKDDWLYALDIMPTNKSAGNLVGVVPCLSPLILFERDWNGWTKWS
jgi:hypothetical protein